MGVTAEMLQSDGVAHFALRRSLTGVVRSEHQLSSATDMLGAVYFGSTAAIGARHTGQRRSLELSMHLR